MQLNPTAGGLPFTSGRSLHVLEAFFNQPYQQHYYAADIPCHIFSCC